MKGTILDYSVQSNEGYISGDDNQRYVFNGAEWKSTGAPLRGQKVDFVGENGRATAVFAAVGASVVSSGGKNKLAAGLLALFLGSFGIHKFYLGYNTAGVIMLLCGLLGLVLLFPMVIVGMIGLIECILYLTKSDEDFERVYVQNKRPWF